MIMKIPTSGSGNGYYGHESSFISYSSDGSEIGNGEEVDSPTLDGDFSEYMWMENEEEFDKEVMQQLEEEALMEQCIEAMLEDEREIRNIHNEAMSNGSPSNGSSNGPSNGGGAEPTRQPWSNGTGYVAHPTSDLPDLCQNMDTLAVGDDLLNKSTLNPNAAEFIPQFSSDSVAAQNSMLPKTS
uniref:Ataxin-2 C-terminal domain-containing protein n=3 Tax=Timema TaxID=61471 RepID=A0A7R9AWW0_TIMSH|nr:unnamed protein product [Timema douglasi]CAD7261908.1 unnamed protein product [Timema shepardi]CAD7400243.1 unnamed protein product [Timema poppensis]